MRYKIIVSNLKNENNEFICSFEEKVIYETDDFNEAVTVIKNYAKNNDMKITVNHEDNVLLRYNKTENSLIVKEIILYEKV